MADIEITYKGNKIVELSESGTKTLKTSGKYCEGDISLSYTKSGGMGKLIKTYTVTESWQNDTLGNPVTIYNTILSDVTTTNSDMFVCIVKNNLDTSSYSANDFVYTANGTNGFFHRNNWTAVRSISTEMSSWISQGATIDIYKIDMSAI